MKAMKIAGVILGAVLLTTMVIDASDSFTGNGGSMIAQLIGVESEICPAGMIQIPAALTFSCVDTFESSPGPKCTTQSPQNQFDTDLNLARSECQPVSEGDLEPWRFITREQASVACARAGKRLPSSGEWYQFALGTAVDKCNINTVGVATSDAYAECLSASGVLQAVGNVWEWVSDDVIDGVYQGRKLPQTGLVVQVDSNGMATITNTEQSTNNDYFWMNEEGAYGIIRGGFYGSQRDAGVFTVHAHTAPTFVGAAVGFRCVK